MGASCVREEREFEPLIYPLRVPLSVVFEILNGLSSAAL
jgi:hypothetical protein